MDERAQKREADAIRPFEDERDFWMMYIAWMRTICMTMAAWTGDSCKFLVCSHDISGQITVMTPMDEERFLTGRQYQKCVKTAGTYCHHRGRYPWIRRHWFSRKIPDSIDNHTFR